MSSPIINEVYPNPETGSEWIELYLNESLPENFTLENYRLFDSSRQIFLFTQEQFANHFLVVEVSGLNNDADQVLLKNAAGEIIDSMAYQSSNKGLSWSREKDAQQFVLSPATPNAENLSVQITPTPTPTSTPTLASSTSPTPVISPTIKLNPSSSPTQSQSQNNLPSVAIIKDFNDPKKQNASQVESKIYMNYDLERIQLLTSQDQRPERLLRLVMLGQSMAKAPFLNVIIGGLLIIAAASLFLYVKSKNKHT